MTDAAPVSVVTGASSGVGRATALHLAARGHHVTATVRTVEAARALSEAAASDSFVAALMDVTDDEAVDRTFTEVLKRHGRIDNLVSNAGIYAGGTIEDMPIDEFVRVLNTNYLGALRCAKAALGPMRRQSSGRIVAVSSQSSRYVLPTGGAYSASKAALEAAFEAMALEVTRFGVSVSIIELGLVETNIHLNAVRHAASPPYEETYRRALAVGLSDRASMLSSDAVAETIERLLGDDAPPLRAVVGADATRNLRHREEVDDDAYVQLHSSASWDDFTREWTAAFGHDLGTGE